MSLPWFPFFAPVILLPPARAEREGGGRSTYLRVPPPSYLKSTLRLARNFDQNWFGGICAARSVIAGTGYPIWRYISLL
ncbi:hypothetical protein CEXT_93701 [Caerostris extrusa]|uniref:Secreted protein n=1 Tax=Caerostris extrusa TaxID=172846 RepID=A0AAV4YCT2_CAEEX|nr:hypothetical protein CEXT_93701 [Caerostris extrusa]